jgi:hypothetical protein
MYRALARQSARSQQLAYAEQPDAEHLILAVEVAVDGSHSQIVI